MIANCQLKIDSPSLRVPPVLRLRDLLVLLVPALSVLVLVSSQTGMNHHLRYAWPVLPFLFVFAGQAAAEWPGLRRTEFNFAGEPSSHTLKSVPGKIEFCTSEPSRPRMVTVAGCVLWSVGSSLCNYPHSLSYFNELAGGSQNGHKHLIHSSLDWGQDLLYVKEWLESRTDAAPFYLAYHGAFDPLDLGISYQLPAQEPPGMDGEAWLRQIPAGWYAISVNYLCGDRRAAPNGRGKKEGVGADAYTAFLSLAPAQRLGGSIWIFHRTSGLACGSDRPLSSVVP